MTPFSRWKQTTLHSWLSLPGSSTNPIEVTDDDEPLGSVTPAVQRHEVFDVLPFLCDTMREEIPFIPVNWPDVRYWTYNRNPWRWEDEDHEGCMCTRTCSSATCDNVKAAISCDASNCRAGPLCGNLRHDLGSLVLMPCIKGLGVFTTSNIARDVTIGEYCGRITPLHKLTFRRANQGFALQFKTRNTKGELVYVDAYPGGSLCRFINHSCVPNCMFEERALRTARHMMITTLKCIRAGDELTVKYNDEELPFTCLCGEPSCVSTRR